MNKEQILEAARKCVCGERQQDYGEAENSFTVIADFWGTYLTEKCVSPGADVCLNPEDVAAMMALLKVARIATGHGKDDNWIDLAGYAACGGEIQSSLFEAMEHYGKKDNAGAAETAVSSESEKDGGTIYANVF